MEPDKSTQSKAEGQLVGRLLTKHDIGIMQQRGRGIDGVGSVVMAHGDGGDPHERDGLAGAILQ